MKYIFSIDQFFTLLALAGIEEFCFLDEDRSDENGQPDEETIIQVLAQLYSGGWIWQEKGNLLLTDKCQNIIRIIQEAVHVIDIEFVNGYYPRQLIYPANKDEIVVVEKGFDGGAPCVRLLQTESPLYIADLFYNDILPGGILEERSEAKQMEEQLSEDENELQVETKAEIVIQKINTETAEAENKIEITKGTIFRQLHMYGKYEAYDHIYSIEEMRELLLKELRGEDL